MPLSLTEMFPKCSPVDPPISLSTIGSNGHDLGCMQLASSVCLQIVQCLFHLIRKLDPGMNSAHSIHYKCFTLLLKINQCYET